MNHIDDNYTYENDNSWFTELDKREKIAAIELSNEFNLLHPLAYSLAGDFIYDIYNKPHG